MAKLTEHLTVTTKEARTAIKVAFKAKRPVFLHGPPGIGKSDVVAAIAKELGGPMIDMRMAQMEATDIRGIPFFDRDTGKMNWAPPIDLPSEEFASQHDIVVLFLDEMNSAPPSVQAAGYQLILNRRIGVYKLPDNVVICAAGNRDGDKGVTYRMPKPLANRFVHLEMRSDHDAWIGWAVDNNIHKDVVGYLSFAKSDLNQFDSGVSNHAFATPRTWAFVSDLLKDEDSTDTTTLMHLIAGTVGEGIAAKFMAHRKFASQMPNPSDILSGKVTDLKVKEISAMYSLTISLCYELKELFTKVGSKPEFYDQFNNFLKYMMDNFETELVIMGIRVALKQYKLPGNPNDIKCFKEFTDRFGKYVSDARA